MKFIRGMIFPNATSSGRGVSWRLKWLYEFWGFVINGTSDPVNPGGFASNNGVVMPTDWKGGANLMCTGTDGSHPAVSGDYFTGDCVFTSLSAPFTASMVGKVLVMWKPGNTTSEDSIYIITRVISSTQIQININTGGIPNPTTKHPSLTARTNVCFRVVDIESASNAGYGQGAAGGFLVLNFDAASINPGQGNAQGISQLQLGAGTRGSFNDTGPPLFASFSGNGAWDGTPSTITAATNASPIVCTTSTPHNYVTGQVVTVNNGAGNINMNGAWVVTVTGPTTFSLTGSTGNGTYTGGGVAYNSFPSDGYSATTSYSITSNAAYSAGQTSVNMIADKTFFICHLREQDLFQGNTRLAIHFEIPKRLYQQGQDLHPMALNVETIFSGSLNTSATNGSYGTWWMRTHSADATPIRAYRTLVKSMSGDGLPNVFGQNLSDYRIGYNTAGGTIPSSDAVLCLSNVANQFQLARVRLRTCRFTGTHVPPHHRIGLNGEFIQMPNGICWPWDNTIQPQQLLIFGSG